MYLHSLFLNGLSDFWIFLSALDDIFPDKVKQMAALWGFFVCLFVPLPAKSEIWSDTGCGCRSGARGSACPLEVPIHMQNWQDKC